MANFRGYFSLKAEDFDYISQILLLLYTLKYSLRAERDCKCVTRTLKSNVLQWCHTKENNNSFVDNFDNMLPLKLDINAPAICTHWVLPYSAGISLISLGLPENDNTDPWVRKRAWICSEIQTLTSSLLDHAVDRCESTKGRQTSSQKCSF